MTLLLIAVNIAVFLYQIALPERAQDAFVMHYAIVPSRLALALAGKHVSFTDAGLTLVTSMFLHAGWLPGSTRSDEED